MKRLYILIILIIGIFNSTIQAQSFSSKEEAIDYSKGLHNGAIFRLQKYLNSQSQDELEAAIANTFAASEIAIKYVSEIADVMSYGSDAVKVVKTCNYLLTFYMHEKAHQNINSSSSQVTSDAILNHYYANLMWMMQMMELNKTIEWLWGSITEQDLNAIIAVIQSSMDDSSWEINDRLAGDKSLIQMIIKYHFDTNCFKKDGRWILF